MKHIPKVSRVQASILLRRLILDIVSDVSQPLAWDKLLHFAQVCLARPSRGGNPVI